MKNLIPDLGNIHSGTRYRIKDRQKAELFGAIRTEPGISRKELSERLKIRPSTVSMLVQELVTSRLVTEGHMPNTGSQGRPEILLHANPNRSASVAIFFVSHEMKAVLLDSSGNVHFEVTRTLNTRINEADFLEAIETVVRRLLATTANGPEVLGVCVTVPGYVNSAAKTWVFSARWASLRNISFVEIEQRLGVPFVLTRALDAKLQYLLLRTPEHRTGGTLLFHWGYGIGAAYSHNGEILESSVGSFCEVGHMNVDPTSNRRCNCGSVGCLETDAALWALIPEFRKVDEKVPEDEAEFQEYFLLSQLHTTHAMEIAVARVAQALSALIAVLLPNRILVYGPFFGHQHVFLAVKRAIKEGAFPLARDVVTLQYVESGFLDDVRGASIGLFLDSMKLHLKAK